MQIHPQAARIEALQRLALGSASDSQTVLCGEVLAELGMSKTPELARDLLVNIGYWPKHVSLSLVRASDIWSESFSKEMVDRARNSAMSPPEDPDEEFRMDFGRLKSYAHSLPFDT